MTKVIVTPDAEGLRQLQGEAKAATEAFRVGFRAFYRPGAPVSWVRQQTTQHGLVVSIGYGERLKVRNDETGATYWVRLGAVVIGA